jgi:hypothetical protein
VSKTRLMTAATLGVAGLMLSGCGSATPGVAVKVGDEELSVREVDAAAVHYCSARGKDFTAALPMGYVRRYVVRFLTLRSQALQIADEYDVEPGSTYKNAVVQLQGAAGTMPQEVRQDYIDVESAPALAQDIFVQVGEVVLDREGITDATTEQVAQAGVDVFNQWPDAHGIEFDPRYGVAHGVEVDLRDGVKNPDSLLTPIDTNTSVEVSETAKSGLAEQLDPALAESLPPTHRCG